MSTRWPLNKHLPILPERPHAGPLKSVSSAQTSHSILPSGQLLLTIQHDTIRGVTPTMLRWWFEHLSDPMMYQGQSYSRYLLWHPRDHIHWELVRRSPSGGAGQGAYFRIVEVFGGNPEFYVDSVEYVEKLDEEGISLVKRVAGTEVFRLEHRFGLVAGGSSYQSRMLVGGAAGVTARLFNRWVRPRIFPDAMGTAWLTHNVEEVGLFEHLLPDLYTSHVNV